MLRPLVLSLALLAAVPAWAEGPQYVLTPGVTPCMVSVPLKQWNAYVSNVKPTPSVPGSPIASIMVTINQTPGVGWSWPCPTTAGQYYVHLRAVDLSGVEGQIGDSLAFVILDALPPPGGISLGTPVASVPPLLTIRSTPGVLPGNGIALVPKGSKGTVVEGPTSVASEPWWRVRWAAGPTGWSKASLLELAAPAP